MKKKVEDLNKDQPQPPKKKKIEDNVKKKLPTVKELIKEKREEFNLVSGVVELGIDKEGNKAPNTSSYNDVIESVVSAGRNDITDETSKDSSSTDDVAVGNYITIFIL